MENLMKLDPVKLVKQRQGLGYSQQNVADKSKVNLRTVQRAEGGFSVSNESAASVAAALQTTPRALALDTKSADAPALLGKTITLHRAMSGRSIIDTLDQTVMCKIECDVEPSPDNLAILKSVATILEENMPEPFNAEKVGWPPSRTLAQRLDLIASLNEGLTALDGLGIGVFVGATWLDAYLPSYYYESGFFYPDDAEAAGCRAARIVISDHASEKLARRAYVQWPVKVVEDFGDEVPF